MPDDNTFGGMPEDEFFLQESIWEDEEYERMKDEQLSHITFEQERIERNRRMGNAGGSSCLVAIMAPVIVILLIVMLLT